MKHQFDSIKIGSIYRPIIPITLRQGNHMVDFHALIDSGTDFNLFPSRLADVLGIHMQHTQPHQIGGVSGSAKAYPCALDIGIEEHFSHTPLMFSYDITLDDFGLLGQRGFFDRFAIEFTYSSKQIILR